MRNVQTVIVVLGVGLFLPFLSLRADAASKPRIEESTRDADKAAARQASSDADAWAANAKKETPTMAEEAAKESAAAPLPGMKASEPATPPAEAPASAPPAEPAKPAVPQKTPRTDLNEMRGKLQSKGSDPKTFRLLVNGGFNVEFTYDSKTSIVNGGAPISIDDLNYGDELVVRYSGRELYAIEVDRASKAPRPQ